MNGPGTLRLRQRDWEPGHGALVRMTARLGRGDVRRSGRRLGHTMPDLMAGRGVEKFARSVGLDATAMLLASPVLGSTDRTVTLAGQLLRLGDWSTAVRRRCPACLVEDGERAAQLGISAAWWASHRTWWDILSVGSCVLHGIALEHACPRCGAAQRWSHGSLLRCRCTASLVAGVGRQAVDPVFSGYVVGRLGIATRASVPLLDGLELRAAVRAAELLGTAAEAKAAVKPRWAGDHLRRVREAGMTIAADWPAAFEVVLDGLAGVRRPSDPDGLIGAYGWVYSELASEPADGFAAAVAAVLRNHAVRVGAMAELEPKLGARDAGTMTATQAAHALGRSYAVTRRKLDEAGAIPRGSRRGVPFTIAPSAVEDLREPRRTRAAEILGVGKAQGRQLEDMIAAGSDPDVREWLATLRQHARRAPPARALPLPVACRNMSVPLVSACTAIMERRLDVSSRGHVEGLAALMVRQDDLAALRPPRGRRSVQAIAREQVMHPEAVLGLVRSGVFGERAEDGSVDAGAVQRFFAQYAPASQLARERGTSPRAFAASMRMQGIEAAFGPPAVRQMLFDRRSLPTLH